MSETTTTKEVPNVVLNFGNSTGAAKVEEPEVSAKEQMEQREFDKLPEPTGYRLLIIPFEPAKKTKGGIHLTEEYRNKEQLGSVVGYVVKLGPDAYKDIDKYPEGPWCSERDWVIFGRYAGARFKIDGGEMRLINDDEVLAVIDNPEDILSA